VVERIDLFRLPRSVVFELRQLGVGVEVHEAVVRRYAFE
jgi:hypothetical protein